MNPIEEVILESPEQAKEYIEQHSIMLTQEVHRGHYARLALSDNAVVLECSFGIEGFENDLVIIPHGDHVHYAHCVQVPWLEQAVQMPDTQCGELGSIIDLYIEMMTKNEVLMAFVDEQLDNKVSDQSL